MISASSRKGLTVVVLVLQVLTGCLFLFAGASKLFGVAEMVNFFAQLVSDNGFVTSSVSSRLAAP